MTYQGEEAVGEVSASVGTTPPVEQDTRSNKSKAKAMSEESLMLRRVALRHLTKSMLADEEEGVNSVELSTSAAEVLHQAKSADDDLPENIFDMDHLLEAMPLLRDDNAFFETMNSDDTIRCPFVLYKPRQERPGIEAVVRFGKSTAGHPKTVHGGVTALTFDNLLGTALFTHGTGPVFTAFLKVDYKAVLPCLTTTVIEVTIDRIDGRKLFVTGRMKSLDGEILFATADALFIKPKKPQP